MTSMTYTVSVVRAANDDASLSNLEISSGDLDPNFSSVTTMYDVSVANDVASVMVTPTATDSGASITVDTNTVESGNASGAITLAEGETTEIKIKVIAADMMTSMTYTVSVARAASSDATLSALGISEGTLDPDFEKDTDMYEVVVRSGLEVVRVTPTASDADGASITVDTNTVESGRASGDITLTEGGTTEIKIKVVAADEITSMTYTVSVERIADNDATLSALGVSSGNLDPNFTSETTMYEVSVANNVASMTVTPTVRDSDATSITVDTNTVASGSASDAITLMEGGTTEIKIKVVAADEITSMTYTVSVARAASSDATLSALEISSGDLDPSFSSVTTMYDVSVANDVENVTVTPTATDGDGASITVDTNTVESGNASNAITLTEGETTEIKIKVIAADTMTSMTYTVSVARAASSDATLSALVISEGTLDPDFEKDTEMYEVVVRSGLGVIRVTPTASDADGASITVDTNTVESGSASSDITLTEGGTTEIKIKVVAADEMTSKTYTVSVERIANDDATLSNLGISSGDLDPNFSSETTMYEVSVANNVASMTVTPTVRDSDVTSITVDNYYGSKRKCKRVTITLMEGGTS